MRNHFDTDKMSTKCLKRAKGVSSVPQVGDRCSRHKDSQSSSSSSLSTRSSTSTIRQFKKAQLAEKKAQEESRAGSDSTKQVPQHLVSHLLPFFYPNDYEYDPFDDNVNAEVPRHLVPHVTNCCYPVSGTADNEEDCQSPRPDVVPPHLEPHITNFCFPVSGTADDEEQSPRSDTSTVPPHLTPHIALYCQPVGDDGTVIEWPTDSDAEQIAPLKFPNLRHSNFVPRHLQSQLFDSDNSADGDRRGTFRPGICCSMTQNHPNMRDSLSFTTTGAVEECVLPRRVGGRRPVANHRNLFEESKPKKRPMSISIVPREPENTKENIFGSESTSSLRSRRRWENDTKTTIFGGDADEVEATGASTPRRRRYDEDTKDKLFGETYGREAEDQHTKRMRPAREDTQMTLFGPPLAATPQRPLSTRSFTSTHDNLFGQTPPSQASRRQLRRENTFDNLFGALRARPNVAGKDERYTTKNPKILQVSSSLISSSSSSSYFISKTRSYNQE